MDRKRGDRQAEMARVCEVCGREVPRRQKYCSRQCAGKSRLKPRITKVCPQCGLSFEVPERLARQKFCSPACSGKARRTWETRQCELCGADFVVPRKSRRRFCGRECAMIVVVRDRKRKGHGDLGAQADRV